MFVDYFKLTLHIFPTIQANCKHNVWFGLYSTLISQTVILEKKQTDSVSFRKKLGMDCGQCGSQLANIDELMFFDKSDKEVHLTLLPEVAGSVLKRSFELQKKGKNLEVLF